VRVRDPSLRRHDVILERSEESRGGLLKDDKRTRNITRSRVFFKGVHTVRSFAPEPTQKERF